MLLIVSLNGKKLFIIQLHSHTFCKYMEFNDQQFSIAWSCMIKVFCYSRYLKEDSVTIVVSAIEPRDNTWMDNSTSTGSPKHRNLN